MNGKWSIEVIILGLAAASAIAPAQEPVAAVNSFQLTRQEALEIGEVAAIGPRLITYQGLIENAGGPIDNQSMVVQFRAFPALAGGTQRGLTVTQTLLASAVRKGVFSVEMDADELALPDNADDTYLEVAVCSPAPCTPVALAPRQHVTAAALAVSARNLGGAAYADSLGALMVGGSGAEAGIMRAQKDLGGGVSAEFKLDASTAAISATRSNGPTPISMESRAPNGIDRTYMSIDHAAAEVAMSREVDAVTAGTTVSPKLRLNLAGPEVAMSASLGANPAALDFKYGAEVAARIGEDPDPLAAGEAVMMVGPKGLCLATEPLDSESNVAAALSNYVRIRVMPAAQANTAALLGPMLQVEMVSNNVPTPVMAIDGDTGGAIFPSAAGVRSDRFKMGATALSNVASGATCTDTGPPLGPDTCVGGLLNGQSCTEDDDCNPGAELSVSKDGNVELKVNNEIVDRWTPVGTTPNGPAPNRIGGSSYNRVNEGIFGATVGGGGAPAVPPGCADDCPSGVSLPPLGTGCLDDCTYYFGNLVTNTWGTVSGGVHNVAGGGQSTVGGGGNNRVKDNYSTIAGGDTNRIEEGGGSGYSWGAIGGGYDNRVFGQLGTVPGGFHNSAGGNYSFAAGCRALSTGGNQGCFVWADAQGMPADLSTDPSTTKHLGSTAPNQFIVRAAGGIWLGSAATLNPDPPQPREDAYFADDTFIQTTAVPDPAVFQACMNDCTDGSPPPPFDSPLDVYGCIKSCYAGAARLTAGGTWTNASDRNGKENIAPVEPREVLEKVSAMEIARWNYKVEKASTQHIGPMAQDFHAAFGLGDSDKSIATIDADGVAFAAIQGLYEIVKDKDCEIEDLREQKNHEVEKLGSEISNLQSEIAELKDLVKALAAQNGERR